MSDSVCFLTPATLQPGCHVMASRLSVKTTISRRVSYFDYVYGH